MLVFNNIFKWIHSKTPSVTTLHCDFMVTGLGTVVNYRQHGDYTAIMNIGSSVTVLLAVNGDYTVQSPCSQSGA